MDTERFCVEFVYRMVCMVVLAGIVCAGWEFFRRLPNGSPMTANSPRTILWVVAICLGKWVAKL